MTCFQFTEKHGCKEVVKLEKLAYHRITCKLTAIRPSHGYRKLTFGSFISESDYDSLDEVMDDLEDLEIE